MICPNCASLNSDYNAYCAKCRYPLTHSSKLTTATGMNADSYQEELTVNQQLGQFRILAKLGEGGIGTVYKAWDCELERPVALKMLRRAYADQESEVTQLLAEAKMASSLNHPNIVTIFGIFRQPECCFIAMEWVDGQTLTDLIPAKGLDSDRVQDFALNAADGLAKAHENGMIHRDIKPANIMITPEGRVKILDFGLARSGNPFWDPKSSAGNGANLENHSGIKGTPAYMSPEQVRGENLDPRTDVYSFGLMLYEACIGKNPMLKFTGQQNLSELHPCSLPSLDEKRPDLPDSFVTLVISCLHPDRESRPRHMGEVLDHLRSIHPPQEKASPEKMGLRAVFLVFGLLIAGWVGWQQRNPGPSYPPIAHMNSLGVIPIENLTGDPALDVYCNGLSATINNSLTRTASENAGTWIVPAGELRRLEHMDAAGLNQNFGVTHALSASLQYTHKGLRLHLNLIETDRLEVVRDTILDLPEGQWDQPGEVVQAVFSLLARSLPPWLRKDLDGSGAPGVHRLYLEGLSYNYRGDVAGNLERAEGVLKKALELDPGHVSAMVALTETYYLMWTLEKIEGSLDKGLIYAQKALTIRDDLASVHRVMGNLLSSKGDREGAVSAFREASKLDPKNADALYGLGVTLLSLERFEESERFFLQATQINPYDWLGQSEFGHLYYRQGKMEEAEAIFQHLAALAPKNGHIQSNLAIILYTLGRAEEALVVVDRALELGSSEFLYMTRGSMEFFLGRFEDAVFSFQAAIKLNPNYYFHHGNLADTLRQLGRTEEAGDAYQRGIQAIQKNLETNPKDVEARIMRVLYLARSGMVDQARAEIDRIKPPGSVDLIYCYALGQELVGRRAEALKFLARALAMNYPPDEIRREPDLADLRGDPRFSQLATGQHNRD